MSLTGDALLAGLGRYLGQPAYYFPFATTAAGSSTSVVSTTLARYDDDTLIDRFFRIVEAAHAGIYQVRASTDSVGSTGTVTVAPAFGTAPGDTCDMEMFRFDPAQMFIALDAARIEAYPALSESIYSDTRTGDGISRVFTIPSTMRKGPLLVQQECPFAVEVDWNFLLSPLGDSTTGYTATGTTASTVDRTDADRVIPKLSDSATKLVTAGSQAATYTLPIASAVNGLTAALAGDRTMTYCRWVYCTEASKVRVQITDDASSSSGSFHGGGGWELLTVERTIDGDNATTLSAVVDIASTANPSTIYVERGWWYFGQAERVRDGLYHGSIAKRVRRDDTTQQVYLDWVPPRGYQLRFIGRDTLSALGTVAATQATNTMEVDEESAELLYAVAAEILLRQQGLAVSDVPDLAQKIAMVKPRLEALKKQWAQPTQRSPLKSMWAS